MQNLVVLVVAPHVIVLGLMSTTVAPLAIIPVFAITTAKAIVQFQALRVNIVQVVVVPVPPSV